MTVATRPNQDRNDFAVLRSNGAETSDDARSLPENGPGWLGQVVSNSSDVIGVLEEDGTVRHVSPSVRAVLGYTPEEVVGTVIFDYVHPDDMERALGALVETLATPGVLPPVEFRARRADGAWRHVEVVRNNCLGDRSVAGVVINVRDVTERVRVEEELRALQREYEELLGSVEAIIWKGEAQTLRFTFVSDQAEVVLGYPARSWTEEPSFWPDHIHPEDREWAVSFCRKAVDEKRDHDFEYRMISSDGSVVWLRDIVRVGVEDGVPTQLFGVMVDITERKEAEKAVEQLGHRNQLILDSAGEGIYGLDREGTTTFVNPAAAALTGYDSEDLVGKDQHEVIHHSRPDGTPYPKEECPVHTAIWDGEVRRVDDEVFWRKDGMSFPVEYTSTPILEKGEIVGTVVTFTDVTERKEAEEALRESEERYRRQSRDLLLLHRARTALARELDITSVLRGVVEAIAETYGYTQVSAYLLEGEELVLQHQVGYREVIERIPVTKGVSGRTVRTGQAVLLDDVRADRDFLGAIEDITSEICVPLFDEGEAVGFINVESRGGTKLTQKDLELMVTLGEHVSVALSRAKLHTQVRRNEERLRSLADAAFEGILITDAGEVLEANRALTDMLGYELVELVGRSALGFVAPEHRDLVRRKISSEDEEPYEIVGLRKNGTLLDLEVRGRAFAYQGRSVRVTAVRDVTERKRAEHRLREAEERYRTLVERVPAMTYIHHQVPGQFSGTTYVSPQVETVLGYTQEEYTADPEFWKTIIHPDDRERVLVDDEHTGETGEPFDLEFRMVAKDGRAVWFRESGTLVREEDGGSQVWHGVMFDITELKRVEGELREAEERYRTLVERIPAITFVDRADGSEEAIYVSPQIERMLGYTPEEWMEGRLWRETLHPEDRERILASDERFDADGGLVNEEYRLLAKDASVVWVREETILVRGEGGEPLYVQGILTDITEKKEAEERLEHQAFHDSLTNLPNRRLFMDRLGQALRRNKRRKNLRVAVLFMDLDGFKVVNDSLGHDTGDRLLAEVAERLKGCLRPEDTLARFGGDEFVVLIEGAGASDAAVRVAERIVDEVREPFTLDGRELYVAASIGVALGSDSTQGPEELLREADTAMYRAKDEGSGYTVFDPTMHGRAVYRLEVENDLRRAVEENEFVVHYQPIVNLQTGELWGMEALVRWDHPERGFLNPDEFVPVAEESGLVVPMGELVLGEACRQAAEWQREYPRTPPLAMSVNLSGRQLRRPDLHEIIGRALERSGLPASSLGLDITETVYISALDANTAALDRLRALGIRLSLDDFGSGYSSLSYLKRLPTDILKIDKSFMKGLGVEVEDTAIVQTVVDLAHILGMEVVGEGVEIEEQETLLKEMGCDFGQGFYFSKPLPPEEVPGFLSR